MSDFWNAVGALGQWAGAVGTIGAVLYVVYGDRYKRPRLRLTFDGGTDIENQTNTPGDPPGLVSRWARVRVENEPGRRLAKGCVVYLTGIRDITAGRPSMELFPRADARRLMWTHVPATEPALDLLPGIAHRADLIGAYPELPVLSVRTVPPYGIDQPGTYAFTLVASAEGADPVTATVTISWNGRYESLGSA